jgi:hypothetical protein
MVDERGEIKIKYANGGRRADNEIRDNYRFILLVRASQFRSVSKIVSIPENLDHRCDWRTHRSRCGILDASRKSRRKFLSCTMLLIRCHSIPLQSDHDHDLVALLSTLGFECECRLFLTDVELNDPSCNINRGFDRVLKNGLPRMSGI